MKALIIIALFAAFFAACLITLDHMFIVTGTEQIACLKYDCYKIGDTVILIK